VGDPALSELEGRISRETKIGIIFRYQEIKLTRTDTTLDLSHTARELRKKGEEKDRNIGSETSFYTCNSGLQQSVQTVIEVPLSS